MAPPQPERRQDQEHDPLWRQMLRLTPSSVALPNMFSSQEQLIVRQFCLRLPGGPGATIYDLETLLKAVPQKVNGQVRYLVSGGFAVDLAAETCRQHKDIDLAFTDRKAGISGWYGVGIDKVTPEEYFAHMHLTSKLLVASSRSAWTREHRDGVEAHIVHPALVLIQKTTGFFGKPPRYKDVCDAMTLAKLASSEFMKAKVEWAALLKAGLLSLEQQRRPQTVKRLYLTFDNSKVTELIKRTLLKDLDTGPISGEDGPLPPTPSL